MKAVGQGAEAAGAALKLERTPLGALGKGVSITGAVVKLEETPLPLVESG